MLPAGGPAALGLGSEWAPCPELEFRAPSGSVSGRCGRGWKALRLVLLGESQPASGSTPVGAGGCVTPRPVASAQGMEEH